MPGSWLVTAAQENGGRTACYGQAGVISYAQLRRRVETFCARLLQSPHAAVIGIHAENPESILLTLHAAARLGRALLPLDVRLPVRQRDALLEQSGCRLVVCDGEMPEAPEAVALFRLQQPPLREQARMLCRCPSFPVAHEPSRIVLIVPTTGTTSDPKGVMLSAANLSASVEQVNASLGLGAADCWLNCLPLNHIGGLSIPYRCVRAGAAMVLHRGFDEERVWRDLYRYPVTHVSLVPAMLGRLLEAAAGRTPPKTLRVALVGGGALDPGLAARARAAGWPLVVCYGMSETASMCVVDASPQAGLQPGRVGEGLPGFRIRLAEGARGRIRVAGEAVMAGYVNPQLRPGDGLQGGWFDTGDLGYRDPDAGLCVSGRADDLMNSGGLRLHPQEVERLLAACPELTTVAVSSRPDPLWGDRLVALYQGSITEAELDAWARTHVPSGLRPREFRRIEVLPRNRMGKLDRRALRGYTAAMPVAAAAAGPKVAGSRG